MSHRIYVDGSCLGNPGRGGYGVAVYKLSSKAPIGRASPYHTNVFNISGEEAHTTNNRMELMAMLTALEIVHELQATFEIHSDSTYVIKGLTEWIAGWKKKGWQTAGKKPVLNKDLWERLDVAYDAVRLLVTIHKVKAHCGIAGNELADRLAQPSARP